MFEIIVIAACLIFNAILSGTEMAFVTVPRPRLRELARGGHPAAQKILSLRDNPERTLSIIQVGITLVGALAAAVGGAGAEESIQPIFQERLGFSEPISEFLSILTVVAPITYLSVVVGELVPKALALRNPQTIVLRAARWLTKFDILLGPIVSALEWSTKKFLQTFFRWAKHEPAPADASAVELDLLSQQTRQYVLNLVDIEKKRVKDVMLPWEQVVSVRVDQSLDEVENAVISSGQTRLPVLRDDTVIGIINTKEFMALRRSGRDDWQTIIRPVVQVQENDPILRALRQMQEKHSHLSIVFSQNRRVGIVTIEDILEEIIGDVFDEDDDGALRRILSTASKFRSMGPKAQ
ncbi:HlyC/CorC family transporter [bacterium]|nr:MAG: HlyC/CorC family transporter [bacterium]